MSVAELSQFPWEVNNVENLSMYRNLDGSYRVSVTEKTQVGNITTKYRSVRTMTLELDEVGTINITSMVANKD